MLDPCKCNTSLLVTEWRNHAHHFEVLRENRLCGTDPVRQAWEAKRQILKKSEYRNLNIFTLNIQI